MDLSQYFRAVIDHGSQPSPQPAGKHRRRHFRRTHASLHLGDLPQSGIFEVAAPEHTIALEQFQNSFVERTLRLKTGFTQPLV